MVLCVTVRHTVVLCGTGCHCVVLRVTVWYCVSLCGTVRHCVVLCVTAWYCLSLCGTVSHCVVLCVTVWYSVSLCCTVCPCMVLCGAGVSLYDTVRYCVSLCVTVCHSMVLCGTVCHCASLCGTVCQSMVLWGTVYHYAVLCVIVWYCLCVSLCGTVCVTESYCVVLCKGHRTHSTACSLNQLKDEPTTCAPSANFDSWNVQSFVFATRRASASRCVYLVHWCNELQCQYLNTCPVCPDVNANQIGVSLMFVVFSFSQIWRLHTISVQDIKFQTLTGS